MDPIKRTACTTLLLSLVAGYCDTATFVSAGGTFSAHVTGNFIVFAAQVVMGGSHATWTKLLTFPVFMLAAMTGGWILQREENKKRLLLIEGCVLIVAGILSMTGTGSVTLMAVVLLTVVAMGMQNAYAKICPKETFGPTTMMTGNVTQAALDLRNLFQKPVDPALVRDSLLKQTVLIGGFLAGCLLGGLLSKYWGLTSLLLAGVVVINSYLICNVKKDQAGLSEQM